MNAKVKILLLAANPKDTSVLRLGEEFRNIKESLQLGKYRDNFEISQGEAVRPKDLRRLILYEKPQLIHFSGHSTTEGIYLENDTGTLQLVSGEALAVLLGHCNNLQCIILNSCYSAAQAKELVTVIPYVIGMKQPLQDDSAIKFSIGFYDALGADMSIEEAFDYGVNAIELEKPSARIEKRSLGTINKNTDQISYDNPIILKNKFYRKNQVNDKNHDTFKMGILISIIIMAMLLSSYKITNLFNMKDKEVETVIFTGVITEDGTLNKLSNVDVTIVGKNSSEIGHDTTGSDGVYHITTSSDQLPPDKISKITAHKNNFRDETSHLTPGISNFTMFRITEETANVRSKH
jgi:hypothetical protein